MSEGRPIVPPVWRGTVFEFDSAAELAATIGDPARGYSYGRYDNPTVVEVEREVARLEGAPRAVAFASGMAAISTAILALLPPGGRVLRQRELYGGTVELFREIVPRFAGAVVELPASEPARFEEELARGADLVYLETPVNPTLEIVDLARIARAARGAGALTLVDNTFATPLLQRPVELGCDVSLHSATKFLGGHHDVLAGVLAAGEETARRVWQGRKLLGGVLSPADAFLLGRGLKTLRVRMDAAQASASALAARLDADPRARRVLWPGLPSHPGHELAGRQMHGFGALLAFEVAETRADAERFLDALRVIRRAGSLGGVESLAMLPSNTSHVSLAAEERRRMGVTDALIRLSVGIEPTDALLEDLERGFAAIGAGA